MRLEPDGATACAGVQSLRSEAATFLPSPSSRTGSAAGQEGIASVALHPNSSQAEPAESGALRVICYADNCAQWQVFKRRA